MSAELKDAIERCRYELHCAAEQRPSGVTVVCLRDDIRALIAAAERVVAAETPTYYCAECRYIGFTGDHEICPSCGGDDYIYEVARTPHVLPAGPTPLPAAERCEAAEAERDALAARLAEAEGQEPCGHMTTYEERKVLTPTGFETRSEPVETFPVYRLPIPAGLPPVQAVDSDRAAPLSAPPRWPPVSLARKRRTPSGIAA